MTALSAVQAPTALVSLTGVSRVYGSGPSEVRALDDVDLEIQDGELLAIVGSSGSGKSTCMNVLGCLDVPTGGRYAFRGVDVGALDADRLALLRRHYIGFVFQSFNLLPRTSALENVELPLVYQGVRRARRRARAREALEQVGLAARVDHTPAQLSGGQQQRVAIARALVSAPALLLADEPTGNLDSRHSAGIMRLLVQLNQERGITVALVTHEDEVAEVARRVITFRDGQIVSDVRQAGGMSL